MNGRVIKKPVSTDDYNLGFVDINLSTIWTYTHSGGSIKIDSRTTLPDISGNLYIIISRNENIYATPQYGDIGILLNKQRTYQSTTIPLIDGDYFIKVVYPVHQKMAYAFTLTILQ